MKPLYDAVAAYARSVAAPFHMPGHKLGKGFFPEGLFHDPSRFDVTELAATDDLHCPRGPLKAAQELAAEAFGAGRTWFLVNGSTCGIHAMVAANCAPGQKLIVARDFHASAFNAMCLARVKPVYVYPRPDAAHAGACATGGCAADACATSACAADACATDACTTDGCAAAAAAAWLTTELPGHVAPEAIERALDAHPDAAALYITRPDYYGGACDLEAIAAAAHRRGVPVLVDEAHGAHFAFSGILPSSALQAGADFCVQSAHKTLPAFTQGAYAHASGAAVREMPERVERFGHALRALQTSSPSFLVMSSLDYAREYMQGCGEQALGRLAARCVKLYARAAAAGYGVPADAAAAAAATDGLQALPCTAHPRRDITRLAIDVTPLGLRGPEVERMLGRGHAVVAEMSDDAHVVFITTAADSEEDFGLLGTALEHIAQGAAKPGGARKAMQGGYPIAPEGSEPPQLDLMALLHSGREWAPLSIASEAGMASAGIVTPYPPGVPLLCPGERVTPDAAAQLLELIRAGVNVRGVEIAREFGGDGAAAATASDISLQVLPAR